MRYLYILAVCLATCVMGQDANELARQEHGQRLHEAVRNGNIEEVQSQIASSESVQARYQLINQVENGETPLLIAIRNENSLMVDTLLRWGANPNFSLYVEGEDATYHPVFTAATQNNISILRSLLQNGGNPNVIIGETAVIVYVVYLGYFDALRELVRHGASVNALTRTTNPADGALMSVNPLHMAVRMDYFRIVTYLLKQGASVHVPDSFNYTPLHIAAARGDTRILQVLLRKRARLNVQNTWGETPLHEAVRNENTQLVNILLQANADPNIINHHQKMPLHIACERGLVEIARSLLQHGASWYARDEDGRKPLDLAQIQFDEGEISQEQFNGITQVIAEVERVR